MSYLVSQCIADALVVLGALKPTATVPPNVQTDAFQSLINLWEQWGADESISNAHYHQALTLIAGQANYTFGTGGSLIATATPSRVYGAKSVSGAFQSEVKVVSFREFDEQVEDGSGSVSILAKTVAADNSYPNINLRVYPIPDVGPGTLYLDYYGAMVAIATTTQDLGTLAPQYLNALKFNLAMTLSPSYARQGFDLTPVAANATSSLQTVQALNRRVLSLDLDQASRQPGAK